MSGTVFIMYSDNTGARRWCFTLNNYTEEEKEAAIEWCKSKKFYVIGEEVGNENGTPHLQGYVEGKSAITFKTLKNKLTTRVHVEKAKGSREQNVDYCKKDGKYTMTAEEEPFQEKIKKMILKEYDGVEWKDWQELILNSLKEKPDDRSINWICDPEGNNGKSYLCKYIAITMDVIICDGKKDNIFNQVKISLEEEKMPYIILLDIPRSQMEYVNYGAIEKLKDGLLYSGKYEGGICVFPHPHVWIFSNDMPEKEKMSMDRWNIVEISSIDYL